MRIIAIGVGGAGCRIVDKLYFADRRAKNSKNPCVEAIAVDTDQKTLKDLKFLPEQYRIYFANLDPIQAETDSSQIDASEISAKVQALIQGETDAIFICTGLGGSLTKAVPPLIETLRKTLAEPLFGLIALPSNADGEKRIADASEDINRISPLLEGSILFDNETWYHKVKAKLAEKGEKKSILPVFGNHKKTPEQEEMEVYDQLNEAMVRRVSLILRAGEFATGGGRDNAEVVLDSGEILNTMLCRGYITIGYSLEHISKNPLNRILKRNAGEDIFSEEQNAKASRIVDLAKEAIYHEISTPCDMTSAQKALVLIAGPSHELSMKGFMTVRKWIDRSIEGIEVRSGDYPVADSSIVAIIIMLAGVHNIPRLDELREIRRQYLEGFSRRAARQQETLAGGPRSSREKPAKDRMIAVPPKMGRGSAPQKSGKNHSLPDTKLPDREQITPTGWDAAEGPELHSDSSKHGGTDGITDLDFWEQPEEIPERSDSFRSVHPPDIIPKGISGGIPERDLFSGESANISGEPEPVIPDSAENGTDESEVPVTEDQEIPNNTAKMIQETSSSDDGITRMDSNTLRDSEISPPEPEKTGKPAPSRHRLIRVSDRPGSTPEKKSESMPVSPSETTIPPMQAPQRGMSHSSLSSRDALIRRPSLSGDSGGTPLSRTPPSGSTSSNRYIPNLEKETQGKPEYASPEKRTGGSGTSRNAFITSTPRENSIRSSQIQTKRFREPGVRLDMNAKTTGLGETKNIQDVFPQREAIEPPATKKTEKRDSDSG